MTAVKPMDVVVRRWDCGDSNHSHITEIAAQKCLMARMAREKRQEKQRAIWDKRQKEEDRIEALKPAVAEMLEAGSSKKQIAESLGISVYRVNAMRGDILADLARPRWKHYGVDARIVSSGSGDLWRLSFCTETEWTRNKPVFEKTLRDEKKRWITNDEREQRQKRRAWEKTNRLLERQMRADKKAKDNRLAIEESWVRAFLMSKDGIAASRIAQTFDVTERTAREYVKRGRLVIATRRMSQHHKGWYAKSLPKEDQQALAAMTDREWENRRWQLAARDFKNI